MVLIATDAAAVMPDISVVNHRSRISHCGMVFRNVRVPVDALPGGGRRAHARAGAPRA
jgi:hypothetical protein